MKLQNKPDEMKRPSDDQLYLKFEVTFGPAFPAKKGDSYRKLFEALKAERANHQEGSLSLAFIERTLNSMEFAATSASTRDEYFSQEFTGSLWCITYGCHSCGNGWYYCNCEVWGEHCEYCGCPYGETDKCC